VASHLIFQTGGPAEHFFAHATFVWFFSTVISAVNNKKHLKNVGPIHHCEPPHAHSPDVASGTVARHLRIDVHDNDNDNA